MFRSHAADQSQQEVSLKILESCEMQLPLIRCHEGLMLTQMNANAAQCLLDVETRLSALMCSLLM